MARDDAIRIVGLRDFTKSLKAIDGQLPKTVRLALNESADLVVKKAKPQFPFKIGRARKSVRVASTRTMARVAMGGNRAPHAPWLDFGGRVGRNNSVRRPFKKDGRYVYPTYRRLRDSGEFERVLDEALRRVAADAGLEIEID